MLAITRRNPSRDIYVSESVQLKLAAAGLGSFAAIWSREADWVEAPNVKRHGWSGVCRLELRQGDDVPWGIYLKRQENHAYRSLRNPFRLQPTAGREYRRLWELKAAAIAAPEVLYYGERRNGRSLQAILMTREVPRSISLDAYLGLAHQRPAAEVKDILVKTAALIARLHRCYIQHCALYGKHVLIRGFSDRPTASVPGERQPRPVLIDVEKARRRPLRLGIALRDLSQFYRRTPWDADQWETFVTHYVAASRMPHLKPVLTHRIRQSVRRKLTRPSMGTGEPA